LPSFSTPPIVLSPSIVADDPSDPQVPSAPVLRFEPDAFTIPSPVVPPMNLVDDACSIATPPHPLTTTPAHNISEVFTPQPIANSPPNGRCYSCTIF
jgi:hypothetical protein